MPQRPKPPARIVAPLGMSATASRALLKTLFIARRTLVGSERGFVGGAGPPAQSTMSFHDMTFGNSVEGTSTGATTEMWSKPASVVGAQTPFASLA